MRWQRLTISAVLSTTCCAFTLAQDQATPASTAPAAAPAAQAATPPTPVVQTEGKVVVPAGTKVLLSLKAAVDTKTAQPGDPIFLTSTFPVIVGDRVIIPTGMDVQGVIDSVERPGKVKGRAKVTMHLTTLVFPNGSVVQIPASVNAVPGADGAKVHGKENTIEQDPGNVQDAKNVEHTTMTTAGLGGLATVGGGNTGAGVGYGALAGSVGGVAYTLLTRGKDVVLPVGQPLEMALQRPLILDKQNVYVPPVSTGVQYVPSPNQPKPLPKPSPQD
ncbi:TrbI/VirB10 family protein [Silvibacterium dinghuense]|nr:TrbI/VirB10 family protein [Silvibacterium dinghuense]GGH13332.1 hypothetical protein GCM10011586_33150 [Silvibacterium dinghuense]